MKRARPGGGSATDAELAKKILAKWAALASVPLDEQTDQQLNEVLALVERLCSASGVARGAAALQRESDASLRRQLSRPPRPRASAVPRTRGTRARTPRRSRAAPVRRRGDAPPRKPDEPEPEPPDVARRGRRWPR